MNLCTGRKSISDELDIEPLPHLRYEWQMLPVDVSAGCIFFQSTDPSLNLRVQEIVPRATAAKTVKAVSYSGMEH
jgi:hypothetical protein